MMPTPLRVHNRWMIRRDWAEVLEIERLCFQYPWSEEQFTNCLRQRNCVGMVAEDGDRVVGHMVYELRPRSVDVLNFAVLPSCQRRGVGQQMFQSLHNKLVAQRRPTMTLHVRETNIDAQLFWSAMGFKAVTIIRDFYEDTDEDAYLFQYRYQAPSGVIV